MYSSWRTYRANHGLDDKRTHGVGAQSLELIFQFLCEPGDILLSGLAVAQVAVRVARRDVRDVVVQYGAEDFFPGCEVSQGERGERAAVPGALSRDEVESR